MSGLSSPGAPLSFPPIQGFNGPMLSAHRVSASDEASTNLRTNRPFVGFDTDMVDTPAGSTPTVSNAVSPNGGVIGDDINDIKTDTKLKTKMAAIPEYFANGKVPKKRGPKPDSRPARDRRQELNRQAQRNHRQRKEENQKLLEEAVAEANQKGLVALRRSQAAEELQQRLRRGHEHLLRENERLKQLLDVNKIPYEHVIPQQDAQKVDRTGPGNAIQQRSDLVSRSLPSQDARVGKDFMVPATHTLVPPCGPTPALPLFVNSSPSDVTLSGMSHDSSSSPVSPMDRANKADAELCGTSSYEYNAISSGHQPIMHIGQTSDALTEKPSGLIPTQASVAASVPRGPDAHNCLTAPSMPSYHDSGNVSNSPLYPSASFNINGVFPKTLKDTPLVNARSEDAYAIPDHDQAGAEFILALEANCHDHKTMMNARTFNDPVQLGGHSLMLTRVPIDVAKKYHMGDAPHPHELPDVGEGPGKYARMLGLVSLTPHSANKDWATQTGEISPAQALGMIRKDPRYPMLNCHDFTKLTNELKDRCRCYGFGAVVEVYEVQDALDDLVAEKGYGVEDGYDLDSPFWGQIPLSNPHTLNGPEFPALDGLMDFDIAALMRDRHSERQQFIAADLRTFKFSASNVGPPVADPHILDSQASSVAAQDSNISAYPHMSTFGL